MEPMKLKVLFTTFSYGGNGGLASQHPDVAQWLIKTILECRKDPRIASVDFVDLVDTPITMTRNRAVLGARQQQADVLVMIDSDMAPDKGGHDFNTKPFFSSSFDFLYQRLQQGKETVVFAPYCGPSPNQCVYVFRWRNHASNKPADSMITEGGHLDMYTREEAVELGGIQEAAAGPTGLIMYSIGAFEFSEAKSECDPKQAIEMYRRGLIGADETLRRIKDQPWFYYDFEKNGSEKCSTEDVVATRDISLMGMMKAGYNPLFCNWDAWAGHWKPECVKKPKLMGVDQVSGKYVVAAQALPKTDRLVMTDFDADEAVELPEEVLAEGKPTLRHKYESNGHNTSASVAPKLLDELKNSSMTDAEKTALWRMASRIEQVSPVPTAIEVGSWIGDSAKVIADAFQGKGRVFCVDHWLGAAGDKTGEIACSSPDDAIFQAFHLNTKQQENIFAVRGKSPETAERLSDDVAMLLLIDADHSYAACLADLRAWWPKLREGGYLVVHDYGDPRFPGVEMAVREFMGELGLWNKTMIGAEVDCLWVTAKSSPSTENSNRNATALTARS